jgi:hypothetical protein
MDAYKMYDDMNKLTATESGFGANAMEERLSNAGNGIALESEMDKFVSVMSSDRNAIDTIIATNAILTEQNKVKDTTIARMAAENANLVMIMTKMVGNKPITENWPGAQGSANKEGGRKLKIQMTRLLIQRDTVGHMDIASIMTTEVQHANGKRRDT